MSAPLIQCQDLALGYETGLAVRHLTFTVNSGDYLCLVGENGSGKSTLVKGLLGLLPPVSGSIRFFGLSPREIGYLPQQTPVQKDFPASVEEVVLSGCLGRRGFFPFYTKGDKARAAENMERLGIAELAGQMEKQTETDRVMVGGAHNILYYPEYADVCRARAFMDALQNRDALITLMRPPQSPVSVRIGGETGIPELSDCSVITAPYRVGRGHMGTIGVVGPMRMNYARVMDTLTLVSRELTGMLSVDALEA